MTRTTRARGSALAAVVVAALVFAAAPAAAQARTVDEACAFARSSAFADKPADTAFATAIDCIAHYGVTRGTTATTYSPGAAVDRDQMASFLVRMVSVGNGAVPDAPDDHFDDDDGNFHEDSINRLFETGITVGFADGTYRPSATVRRDQMASFIARTIEHTAGVKLADPAADHFTDDQGNTHERRINQLADLGVVQGKTADQYDPAGTVTRGQMALFLARALDYLTEIRAVPLRRVGVADATGAPELVAATRVGSTSVVRFSFDEEVNSAAMVTGGFKVTTFAAAATAATSVRRAADDPRVVEATFPASAGLDTATTASVARAAVQDPTGVLGPEGAAGLAAVELPAATTAAPDLRAVAQVGGNPQLWRFDFDEPAFVVDGAGFHVVLSDGTVEDGSQATAPAGGSTTVGVTFTGVTAEEAPRVVRAYVEAGAVSDQAQTVTGPVPPDTPEGTLNPQQAVAVAAGGATSGPDLVSFIVQPAASTAIFVFDEAVAANPLLPLPGSPNRGAFHLYRIDGSTVSSTSVASSSSDNRAVVVTFGEGEVSDVMAGASVDADAVVSRASSAENAVAAAGVARSFAPGRTAAPDLVGAGHTQAPATLPPGSSDRAVVFIFDQPVEAVSVDGTFAVVDRSGKRTVLSGCAAAGSRVTCTASSVLAAAVHEAIGGGARATVAAGAVQDLGGGSANGDAGLAI